MLNIVFIIYITLYKPRKKTLETLSEKKSKNFKKLEKRC